MTDRTLRDGAADKAGGTRLLVAGAAVGASFAMVGTMAAAAQAGEASAPVPATTTIQRVVVLDTPSPAEVVVVMAPDATPQPEVVRRVVTREVPAPAAPAPQPQTDSGGS
jgi:hypothetical protein